MLTNKKLLLPGIGLAVVAALAVVIGFVAASSGDGSDGSGGRESVSADDSVGSDPATGGLAMCAEDVPDCNDMIVDPDGDVSQDSKDPEEPVSSDPVTSIDDIAPDECNLAHNIDACERQATAAAVADLARNIGVSTEAITVVSAELTEWPDACLGVGQPKVACAEVITPGFKIALKAGNIPYEYRTDATGATLIGGK